MYLHKVLQRSDDHWTKKMLYHLKTQNTGWAKNIQAKLAYYELEQDWEKIKEYNKSRWRHIVNTAVRAKNKQKLLEGCIQQGPNGEKIKTKTAYIYHNINDDKPITEALPEIVSLSKVNTKTVILGRCGMLECGKNFKGSIPEMCRACGEDDDESHRLNRCNTWRHLNLSETVDKIDFGDIYSSDINVLIPVIRNIQRVWELQLGNGSMKKQVANSD